jgi:hypothetical protein
VLAFDNRLIDEKTGFPTWIDLMPGKSSRARREQAQLAAERQTWCNFVVLLNGMSGERLAAWVSNPWAPSCDLQELHLTGIDAGYYAAGETTADTLRTLSPQGYERYPNWLDEQRRAAALKEYKRRTRFFGIERKVRNAFGRL